jgi:hypothetical protein
VSSLSPDSGDGVIRTEGIDSEGVVIAVLVVLLLSSFAGGKEQGTPLLRLFCSAAVDTGV